MPASITALTVGTIVACYLPKYSAEEPQLGKLINGNTKDLEIEWMVGSYNDPWKIWKEKKGKEYVTWREVIPTDAVLFPVSLSKTERISSSEIVKLKTAYREKRKV